MLLPESPSDLYQIEAIARNAGYHHIIGIDEVGRGPLAGPVVAAAVKLPGSLRIEHLAESKQLNPVKREIICKEILNRSEIEVGIALVSAQEIDRINILQATYLAMRKAVLQIKSPVDFIFVDGLPVPDIPYPSQNIIKGDAKSACIAAASIVAKVYRDDLMIKFDQTYPGYGFHRHKGYGTKEHIRALHSLGPCRIHRRSFAPVAKLEGSGRSQPTFCL